MKIVEIHKIQAVKTHVLEGKDKLEDIKDDLK
jgi:hypothetical protein